MNVINCINDSLIFLYINNIVDIVLGLTLCLFSCKCNEKVLAFFIGIHGGFWTGVIIETIFWGNSWFIGGLLGAFFFSICSLKSQRCGRVITVFVTVSKFLFWIFVCSANGVGIYDENVKIFCFSVIGGLVCGILSELFYSREELIIMCCHVLLGTGLIGGVISNFVCNPRYEYFGDIINNKSELLEYISFYYKMNFLDDGHLIYLIFFCFVGIECQIIMKIRKKKREQGVIDTYEGIEESVKEPYIEKSKMELVREIINEWDPISLFPMAPKNEYESEIVEVYNLLRGEDLSIERIEEGIEKIFTKAFGADVFYTFTSKCKCREVAEKLHQIL